jgi:hypothetical protein
MMHLAETRAVTGNETWSQPIPAALRASPLLRGGGYGVYAGLLDDDYLRRMRAEARGQLRHASETSVAVSDGAEGRGGSPARRFLTAPAGPAQDGFYNAPGMLRFLADVTGLSVRQTGERGTYTYYARPGDHLALHRDVVTCDLAVITCLHDGPATSETGGLLCLYPGRVSEPLSAIRATPSQGAVGLRLEVGHTLVLLGGIVPHAVLPVAERQARVVSVLCYEVEA